MEDDLFLGGNGGDINFLNLKDDLRKKGTYKTKGVLVKSKE